MTIPETIADVVLFAVCAVAVASFVTSIVGGIFVSVRDSLEMRRGLRAVERERRERRPPKGRWR